MAKKENSQKKESSETSKSILGDFLKSNKEKHLNFEKSVVYKVPSGSLLLDISMGGGLTPGCHRFTGASESGKTSSALSFMRLFLQEPDRKGIYIKAEGRLSEEMQARSGVKFTFDAENWESGSCFVFESNMFETCMRLIEMLVKNNPEDYKYFVFIDSMDGLISESDIEKDYGEATKVAGGVNISGTFLKKLGLWLGKKGHVCIMSSQVRATIKINPYEKGDPRLTNATGGNALNHHADYILEFQQKFNNSLIKKGEKILGHYCKIIFRKSPNEITGQEVSYPVKYGQTNGKSVWIAKELVDAMLTWEMASKGGAWITIEDSLRKELLAEGFEVAEKYQGIDNFADFIESNDQLIDFLYKKFTKLLSEM